MSLSDDITRFKRKALKNMEQVKRASVLDLFASVTLATPVDKGVLINNWFVGIGAGSGETTGEADPSVANAVSKIETALNAGDMLKDVYLTNNLPYAATIEFDGHSGKAPQGMVRVNTARWDTIVKNNVRALSNG